MSLKEKIKSMMLPARAGLALALALGAGMTTVAKADTTKPPAIFHKIFSFGASSGATPRAPLVRGSDGNFYGSTYYGGSAGLGALYQMKVNGTVAVLHSFASCGTEGCYPSTALVEGPDKALYGTTYYGGSAGLGTVFRVTRAGEFSVLYSFTSCATTGCYPKTALTIGNDGFLYGTTYYGGGAGLGTVFKISTTGTYSQVYAFPNCSVACYPMDALVQASDGKLYGASYFGGSAAIGSIYSISLGTSPAATQVYAFPNCKEGCSPRGGLTLAKDGSFYGVTYAGGSYGVGTVFQFKDGVYTMLAAFTGTNGASPISAPLLLNGRLYGTTPVGGDAGVGVVYGLPIGGTMARLHSFALGLTEGPISPAGSLTAMGKLLIGTTAAGGDTGLGAAYFVLPLTQQF